MVLVYPEISHIRKFSCHEGEWPFAMCGITVIAAQFQKNSTQVWEGTILHIKAMKNDGESGRKEGPYQKLSWKCGLKCLWGVFARRECFKLLWLHFIGKIIFELKDLKIKRQKLPFKMSVKRKLNSMYVYILEYIYVYTRTYWWLYLI